MPSIRRMGEKFAADGRITADEAKALVDKVKSNGIVSIMEKWQLRNVLKEHADLFEPVALETVKALLEGLTPAAPAGSVVSLDASGAYPPVFLTSHGGFTVHADGRPPANDVELGDALYRAAAVVDDAQGNVFAPLPESTRAAMLENLRGALAKVPAGGTAPSGLDAQQAVQLRASASTALLHLLEASPEAALRGQLLAAYEKQVLAETDPRLRENMIFHLANAQAAKSGPVKEVADRLMKELAPIRPPYEKWFANGNDTLRLSWTVGHGEFWKGFTNQLKRAGFKPVGTEDPYGVSTYEATFDKPGVGPTKFRIDVREGGTDILSAMNDSKVHVVGYDGHSNWGRNMSASVKSGPPAPHGADGKLLFYNLCVGKGVLDRVKEKYPNCQVVTTYAASNFYTDGHGQMTTGEGVQALLALVKSISERADWSVIHQRMNDAADIGVGRTWDNYLTPISTVTREKVLDRDNDGQADYLDKHFNYNLVQVADDTQREFTPVRQSRAADRLDGTKVLVSANMINTLSEFSSILEEVNPDSKVVPFGWFEPKMGERDVVRFSQAKGADGKSEFRMQVSSRYAHMSEEALRATAIYEFNRYLAQGGKLHLGPVEAKLAGLIAFGQSLRVDEGYRDADIWKNFIARYNFPADLSLAPITSLLTAEHHRYAGSPEMVNKLKAQLSPQQLSALARPEVGEPVQLVG
ncbi:MAG: hypothetical protein ACOZIN_00955 [Myxococcota bacterium]